MKKFLFIALAAAALIFGAIANAQTQINQANIGSFPYTISKPGSYILTSNLSVTAANTSAIVISASNVTLNLNGYMINGPLQCTNASCNNAWSSYAVLGSGNNIAIINGNISGFYAGAQIMSGRVEDLNVTSCQYGIIVSDATVKHNQVSNIPAIGIYASYSSVLENQASYVYLALYGYYSTFANNEANSNTVGLTVAGGSASGNSLYGNTTDINLSNGAVSSKTNFCTSGAC
jgi:hypothetical protein